MPIIAVLIITALAGGGVSAVAESALPGDALYAVKVSVNEEVRAAFTFSAESKANWEARRAERRLEEAEKLSVENRLSADARAKVEANFKAFADRVHARIADFEAKENFRAAADVSSNFETSLNAHGEVLLRLAAEEKDEKEKEELGAVAAKVRTAATAATKARGEAEVKLVAKDGPEAQTAAEGKLKAAENKIEEVGKFIEASKAKLGAQATAEAEARLKVSQDLVASGKAKLDAKAYGEAFVLFQKAHRTAQEAKLMVASRVELKVDVKMGMDKDEDEEEDGGVKDEAEVKIKTESTSSQIQGGVKLKIEL